MVARVGIFDSGVGGLSVAAALHRHQPSLAIRYLADTAFFPYGGRTDEEVTQRALTLGGWLVEQGADALVVACNTASSAALERLREAYDLPIIGMEPPLKPAVEASASRTVAVLATPGTVRGRRLASLEERYADGARVFTVPMPGLADLVESGEVDGARVEEMLRSALDEPVREGADAVALGCTHYGFLRPVLDRLLPSTVRVIDAAEPVARRALHVLRERGFEVDAGIDAAGEAREVLCYATGDPAALEATIERLRRAGADLPVLRVCAPVAPVTESGGERA
ncbi:MAG: glutamate racemase [Dehalococcoidia bacterium]